VGILKPYTIAFPGLNAKTPQPRRIMIYNYDNDLTTPGYDSDERKVYYILEVSIKKVEYLKAMKIQKSQLIPIGIRREKVFYNSTKIVDEYASSTGIRHLLLNNNIEEIARVIPSSSFNILLNNIKNGTYTLDLSQYSLEIIYKLRTMSIDEIRNLPEVSEGLENSIKDKAEQTNNLIELINNIKSKRYTQTRIQRIMVYALLGITKKDMEMSKKITPYVRILGCSQEGKKMLSEINWKSKVITSVKKFEDSNYNKNYKRMLEIDKRASDIYTMGYRANSKCNLDYTTGIIVL
jgi:predicted nucleotidyltransferase